MNIEELAFKNYYELISIQKTDLLLIIEFLQKDRKEWINQFTKTHNESIEIQKENQELKQKYVNAVADYETTMAEKEQLNSLVNSCQEEIRQLKKQLEETVDEYIEFQEKAISEQLKLRSDVENYYERLNDKETQQKEFIKYLEDMLDDENDIFSVVRIKDVLQNYKSIIGDDK